MRLLNVKSRGLEDFRDDECPEYSIFSHTWGEEEVTYEHLIAGTAESLEGYKKLLGCCRVSANEGYRYTWIDTCCIDKSSSAELSEAINSMFRFYGQSAVCYAYLSDVGEDYLSLSESRWFSRGWTLQELIAPSDVVFLDSQWREIGTKSSLTRTIASITGINPQVLSLSHESSLRDCLDSCSIAERISWAADRRTTRLEDMAYCLFGLFDVHMPLIYGEGAKAFLRLQLELMSRSDDMSIFAWEYTRNVSMWRSPQGDSQMEGVESTGLLAPSPSRFKRYQEVRHLPYRAPIFLSRNISTSQTSYTVSKTSVSVSVSWLGFLNELSAETRQALKVDPARPTPRWHRAKQHFDFQLEVDQRDSWSDFRRMAIGNPGSRTPSVTSGSQADETSSLASSTSSLSPQNSRGQAAPEVLIPFSRSHLRILARGRLGSKIGIAMLECGNRFGRVGILLRSGENGMMERCHTSSASLLFLEDDKFILPPTSQRLFALYSTKQGVQFLASPTLIIRSHLESHGYNRFLYSTPSKEGNAELTYEYAAEGSSNLFQGFVFFQSSDPDQYPCFVVLWRYAYAYPRPEIFLHCEVVEAAFAVDDIESIKWDVAQENSSWKISELRQPLSDERQVVIKVRAKGTCSELGVLVEDLEGGWP